MQLYKLMLFLLLPSFAHAQLSFQFVEDRTSDPIATLELAQLSSDVEDILSLSFTTAGQSRFGYGPLYEGTFDSFFSSDDSPRFVLDKNEFGVVGLGGEDAEFALGAGVFDSDPPDSSLPGVEPTLFEFNGIDAVVQGSFDSINLRHAEGAEVVSVLGQWVLVPEPTGLSLFAWFLVAFVALRGQLAIVRLPWGYVPCPNTLRFDKRYD